MTKHVINEALMPIVQQEGNFEDAPPQLFGPGFAKEHVDQMKAMRASLPMLWPIHMWGYFAYEP